jgi:hypothetical protein
MLTAMEFDSGKKLERIGLPGPLCIFVAVPLIDVLATVAYLFGSY